MRKLLKDFLLQKNYQILEAEDGEKALQVYKENQNKINLILLNGILFCFSLLILYQIINNNNDNTMKKNYKRKK